MRSKPDVFKPHSFTCFVTHLMTPHNSEHTPVPKALQLIDLPSLSCNSGSQLQSLLCFLWLWTHSTPMGKESECAHFHLASLARYYYIFIHIVVYTRSLIPFCDWVILFWNDIPQFASTFLADKHLGCLLFEQGYNETAVMGYVFFFSWVLRKHRKAQSHRKQRVNSPRNNVYQCSWELSHIQQLGKPSASFPPSLRWF